MKSTAKLLLLLAALVPLTSAYAATPSAEPAQSFGQGQSQTITCSSNNGRRNRCNVNTRGGVRISRQISGTPCVQNQTWGWDNSGIWVDGGCRAEFIVGSGNTWANRVRPSPAPPITADETSVASTPAAASVSTARSAALPVSRIRPGGGTTVACGSTVAAGLSSS